MLILKKEIMQRMIEHCLKVFPLEGCGLLGGVIQGANRIVQEVYLLTNVDQSPEHFSMDPREQFAALKEMRRKGLSLLGNFHSHPATPARPSEEDKRLAYDPEASYVILSLMNQAEPVLKSFRILDGKSTEEVISIV